VGLRYWLSSLLLWLSCFCCANQQAPNSNRWGKKHTRCFFSAFDETLYELIKHHVYQKLALYWVRIFPFVNGYYDDSQYTHNCQQTSHPY
jgi:hypothetical protein